MIILSALLAFAAQEAQPFRIDADLAGTACTYKLDGVAMERRALEKAVLESGRPAPIKVKMSMAETLPYRCIAPLQPRLRLLELRGIPFKQIAGVAPAKIVRLGIPAWGCAPTIDGQTVYMDDLPQMAAQWERDEISVDFQPDGETPVSCADRVLQHFIDAKFTRLGFTGTGFGE